MVITDPPYNVAINGHVCGSGGIKHKEFAMASGEMSQSEFTVFLSTMFTHLHTFVQDGAIVYSFMDWRHMREIQDAALPIFGAPRQLCIWTKDNGGMGTFYRSQHELVFVFKKGDAPHINNFELGQYGRYRTNVWNYPGVNTFNGQGYKLLALHPTVKPVSLIADAIRDCSHRKGIVLDPFAGSGTILIAAERTGRHARAIEFDPQYVDVAIMRWQRVTGKQAVLSSTGQSWDQVREDRLAAKA
jgi:DNA modification methylase